MAAPAPKVHPPPPWWHLLPSSASTRPLTLGGWAIVGLVLAGTRICDGPVVLPDFAVQALCRRRESARANPYDAVFPTRNGTWQQVNNVERRWRRIRQDTGLDWVTPHTFRKTVATLISERVSSETASQQLGHSAPAITREFYISKPAIAADVAHVLQELSDPSASEDDADTSGTSAE